MKDELVTVILVVAVIIGIFKEDLGAAAGKVVRAYQTEVRAQ